MQQNKDSSVSPAVIKRLPRYFRYLRDLLRSDILRISSSELSKMMNVTASQIRQDFNCFGGFGQQGYGYNVKYLYGKISDILGVTNNYNAIIVGVGNLGRALAGNSMFARRGVTLCALFDINPQIIDTEISGFKVIDIAKIDTYCDTGNIDIAVLTLPKSDAKEVAEYLVKLGIKGFWNFSNMEIELSEKNVMVQNVHLGDTLMTLCYEISTHTKLD